jgi:hypothetical protein
MEKLAQIRTTILRARLGFVGGAFAFDFALGKRRITFGRPAPRRNACESRIFKGNLRVHASVHTIGGVRCTREKSGRNAVTPFCWSGKTEFEISIDLMSKILGF